MKPRYHVNDLVRVSILKKTLSIGDTTNWSHKLYYFTKINNDTLPGYKIEILSERYNEALLKKTELTLKENKDVMNHLNIT